MTPSSTTKNTCSSKGLFRRCWSTTWTQFCKYSSGACRSYALGHKTALGHREFRILLGLNRLSSLKKNLLWAQGFGLIPRSNNSTRVSSSSTSRTISNLNRTSVSWFWPTQICTQRRDGHLFSAWLNRVGGSAFRATQGITPTLPRIQKNSVSSAHRFQKRFSIGLSRRLAMKWPMCYL